jgi:hypothetical protein
VTLLAACWRTDVVDLFCSAAVFRSPSPRGRLVIPLVGAREVCLISVAGRVAEGANLCPGDTHSLAALFAVRELISQALGQRVVDALVWHWLTVVAIRERVAPATCETSTARGREPVDRATPGPAGCNLFDSRDTLVPPDRYGAGGCQGSRVLPCSPCYF